MLRKALFIKYNMYKSRIKESRKYQYIYIYALSLDSGPQKIFSGHTFCEWGVAMDFKMHDKNMNFLKLSVSKRYKKNKTQQWSIIQMHAAHS